MLAEILTRICNASLREGGFPDNLKGSIVQLRVKKRNLSPDDTNSSRPLSHLSFLSKVVVLGSLLQTDLKSTLNPSTLLSNY